MQDPQLESRLKSVEDKLQLIEKFLGLADSIEPLPQKNSQTESATPPPQPKPQAPRPSVLPPLYRTQSARAASVSSSVEKPGNWLGLVALLCFVLAGGFIIKLSIESGWLTPARQVGIAGLLGAALIATGLKLLSRDREYASLLPAAGIAILFLTVFAAHRLYDLIGFDIALVGISLSGGLCLWLYNRIKHDVFAVIAALCCYGSPFVLNFPLENAFGVAYLLICSLAFSSLSIVVEARLLAILGSYCAIFSTTVLGLELKNELMVALVLMMHFLIYSLGTALYSREKKVVLSGGEAAAFLPVLVIFYASEYYFLSQFDPVLAPWISLGFAAMVFGLAMWVQSRFPDTPLQSQGTIWSFLSVVLFHSLYLNILPSEARPWLLILMVIGFAWKGSELRSRAKNPTFAIPMLALFLVAIIEYGSILLHLVDVANPLWIFTGICLLFSLWGALLRLDSNEKEPALPLVLFGAAHVLALVSFYRLTHKVGSLAVSGTWLVYAVLVIGFAYQRRDEMMARSALLILSFAAAKALLFDAASAPTVVRILCLLLTGAVLYGSGMMLRQISSWKRTN